MPLHFTPQARPSSTPAPKRHHRKPSRGPNTESSTRFSVTTSAILARTRSRSTSRQENAASTNSAWKTSSIPTRACTWLTPSQISRTPASAPSRVERVMRRAIRMISSTIRVPASAALTRQPQGV